MPILEQRAQDVVRERFEKGLHRNVKLRLVTQRNAGGLYIPGRECASCGDTERMLKEVSALSPKIGLEIIDFYGSPRTAEDLGVDKIPALIVGDGGARFYGLPGGYEFSVLVDTIVEASSNGSSLDRATRKRLRKLKEDVHIQVFVTPG